MIHQNSKDPVLVKKISLKAWRLKDEIKALIKDRLGNNSTEEEILAEMGSLFTKEQKPALSLVKDTEEDQGQESDEQDQSSEEPAQEEMIDVVQLAPELKEEDVFYGKTFLAEVTMEKIHFFCNETFLEGQSIVLQFLVPKPFIVSIEILSSRPYSLNSRIISELKLPYRIAAKFTFSKPGERSLLRDFLTSVEPDLSTPAKKVAPPKKDDAGDMDLADLADLDL